MPRVDLAARYETAQHGDIGGDFYDVMDLRDTWMVADDPEPAHVLGVLNDGLLDDHPERFCTAV